MDKRRMYISSVLVILGIAVCAWTCLKPREKKLVIESEESKETGVSEISEETETKKIYPVYIGGAVKDPGVFQIEEYIYLYKLIEKAGGFTEDADSEHIDRVYLVDRPQSIYIPRIGEDLDDADLSVPSIGEISAHEDVKGGNGERVDINDAGVSELSQLPGIGPKTAEKIISYRETNGRFETKEDIMKVPGIGESKFEKIKDLIFTG